MAGRNHRDQVTATADMDKRKQDSGLARFARENCEKARAECDANGLKDAKRRLAVCDHDADTKIAAIPREQGVNCKGNGENRVVKRIG